MVPRSSVSGCCSAWAGWADINTTKTTGSIRDSYSIRRTSLMNNIPYYTTIAGAKVAIDAIENLKNHTLNVKRLQSIHWKILTLKNIWSS